MWGIYVNVWFGFWRWADDDDDDELVVEGLLALFGVMVSCHGVFVPSFRWWWLTGLLF